MKIMKININVPIKITALSIKIIIILLIMTNFIIELSKIHNYTSPQMLESLISEVT